MAESLWLYDSAQAKTMTCNETIRSELDELQTQLVPTLGLSLTSLPSEPDKLQLHYITFELLKVA